MSSEYQELLEKLLNSDTTDVIPQSRAEYIILTAINSLGIDTLPEPDSRIEAYLMALITKMSEGGSASQTQPDWNQNDSTQPDYVKNRPFYTSDPVETEIFDVVALMDAGAYQWDINNGDVACGFDFGHSLFFDTPLVVGDKYKIQSNVANYECIAIDETELDFPDGVVILTDNVDGLGTSEFEFFAACGPYTLASPSDTSGKWIIILAIFRNTEIPPTDLKVISQKTKIVKINPNYIDFPVETDPTVPAWAKEPTKPTYTASDIGAISAPATAEVGQTMVVKSVDKNGHPTEWEAVSIPTVNDILAALPAWEGGSY